MFQNDQFFYCMVCCSTDPSVPPDSSVYSISTNRGTEVNVYLDGLTSGQMYYCKVAATNTNSTSCSGPVVGGVKVLFSLDLRGDILNLDDCDLTNSKYLNFIRTDDVHRLES